MKTQGEILAAALKRRPHTYRDMLSASPSCSPHRRLREWERRHPDWRIQKGKHGRWKTWRIVRVEVQS